MLHDKILLKNKVFGYDQNQSAVTEMLSREGAIIHDTEIDLPEEVVQMPDQTMVVYTPAFSKHHKLYKYLFDNGYTMKSRSSILGSICKGKKITIILNLNLIVLKEIKSYSLFR